MTEHEKTRVRTATPADLAAVRAFGEAHIPDVYTPLIGAEAAARQVTAWWSDAYLAPALAAGLVLVAERDGEVVGVAQRGRLGDDHVVFKLYVAPELRGYGLGPRLLDAVDAALPASAPRLVVEHLAANERAAAFYEREGFALDRVEPHDSGDPRRATVWRSRERNV
jgi:ribosomal protein S18 acetylase RimI-like enzyme